MDVRMWDERFWEQNEVLWNILFKHRGHKVEIATYGNYNNPSDMCLECLDCNQVILDEDLYTITHRSNGE